MRTSTPISSISYNTDSFIVEKLNDLVMRRVIEFWVYINHLGDTDDSKGHKHVYIIPSRQLDTFVLSKEFDEPDIEHPDLPPLHFKAIFRTKSFVDWYLYALHDKDYLSMKGMERNYHYRKEDMIFADEAYFNRLLYTSDFTKYKNVNKLRDAVKSGATFAQLFSNGFIPVQQIKQYKYAFDILQYENYKDLQSCLNESEYEYTGGGVSGHLYGVPERPARGKLTNEDYEYYIDRYGEIFKMQPICTDALPFGDEFFESKNDSKTEKNSVENPKNREGNSH